MSLAGAQNNRLPPRPAKKSVNLSIDAEIASEAKSAGINMSGVLEAALRDQLKVHRAAKWKEENREAIESMNAHVDAHGLPLAKFRTW